MQDLFTQALGINSPWFFIDLSLSEAVPDHSTIWRFRQLLNTENLLEALLEQINHQAISGAGPSAVTRWKKQYLAEINGQTPKSSKATFTKKYSIVWIKGNSLIVIIDSFLSFGDRGVAYANLGEYQKAINDCDQAITLNPNDENL
jgi:tetratricopeptide (TPR) repeat protein